MPRREPSGVWDADGVGIAARLSDVRSDEDDEPAVPAGLDATGAQDI